MKTLAILLFLIFFFMSVQLTAQPVIKPEHQIQIYNADELIKIGLEKGLDSLPEFFDPINLVYIDASYADILMDIEFKSGFVERYSKKNEYFEKNTPDLTFEIANAFGNNKAKKKLFEYYCSIPKVFKSDTIYNLYYKLDYYLSTLVTYKSSFLIKRLVDDYHIWKGLIENTPKIKYPTPEERSKESPTEWLNFHESELYNDPRVRALQIAGALNYLKVKGFNKKLLDSLVSIQSCPWYDSYSFKKPEKPNVPLYFTSIKSKIPITNFEKDYEKILKIINKNLSGAYGSEIRQVVEKENIAYINIAGANWDTDYIVRIKNKNTILVALISQIVGQPLGPIFKDDEEINFDEIIK